MPSKPLPAEQREDAMRLKRLFQEWQDHRRAKGLPWSQEHATEALGFGQSALAQYLNGRIPLNIDSANKFAKLIGRDVAEFSPTLAMRISALASTPARASGAPDVSGHVFTRFTDENVGLLEDFLAMMDDDQLELGAEIRRRAAKARAYLAKHAPGLPVVSRASARPGTGKAHATVAPAQGHLDLEEQEKRR